MAPRRGARGGWLGRPPKNGRGAGGRGRSAATEPEFPDLSGFEFFAWVPEDYLDSIRLPTKFAEVLRGREPRELMIREAGDPVYNVEVHLDDDTRWTRWALLLYLFGLVDLIQPQALVIRVQHASS